MLGTFSSSISELTENNATQLKEIPSILFLIWKKPNENQNLNNTKVFFVTLYSLLFHFVHV